MKSPTAETKDYLEAEGWLVEKVERVIPHTHIKVDLCGCIDLLCFRGECTLGVQATDATSHSKRVTKAIESPKLVYFLTAKNLFEVWSWAMRGPRGQKKKTARVTQLVLQDGRVTPIDKL